MSLFSLSWRLLAFTQLVWGWPQASNIGFKKISELTADEKHELDLKNSTRITKATLAVVNRKIAEPASRVVARQNDAEKVARERAPATARQQKLRAS